MRSYLHSPRPLGVPRFLGMCDDDATCGRADCNWNTAREGVAELKAFPESAAQTASTGSLGDLPLAVLSHDPDKPSSEMPPELAKSVNDAVGENAGRNGPPVHARNADHRQEQRPLHPERQARSRDQRCSQHRRPGASKQRNATSQTELIGRNS